MSGRPPGKPDLSGYNYGAISSLVLTADHSTLPRWDKEPDSTPTTLSGRIDPREMGSHVQRAAPKDLDKKEEQGSRQAGSLRTRRQVEARGR
jgi:pre-mRNA-splicing helicase BRR2